MKQLVGILCDVEVQVAFFTYPVDFMILEYEVDVQASIIVGRPFLYIGKVLIYMDLQEITFRMNNKKLVFYVCVIVQQLENMRVASGIDIIDDYVDVDTMLVEEILGVKVPISNAF